MDPTFYWSDKGVYLSEIEFLSAFKFYSDKKLGTFCSYNIGTIV